jgi:Family of unknown function (DUF6011)
MIETATRQMTAKQVSYIRDLLASRVVDDADRQRLMDLLSHAADQDTRWASKVIAWLLRRPKQETPPTVAPTAPEKLVVGVYQLDGQVYVVRPTKISGHLAAYRVVEIGGQRVTQVGETVSFELRYARGLMAVLRMSHRMPLEAAEKLMIRYGRCICCRRPLKDATSVKNGIGPICAKRYFGV